MIKINDTLKASISSIYNQVKTLDACQLICSRLFLFKTIQIGLSFFGLKHTRQASNAENLLVFPLKNLKHESMDQGAQQTVFPEKSPLNSYSRSVFTEYSFYHNNLGVSLYCKMCIKPCCGVYNVLILITNEEEYTIASVACGWAGALTQGK